MDSIYRINVILPFLSVDSLDLKYCHVSVWTPCKKNILNIARNGCGLSIHNTLSIAWFECGFFVQNTLGMSRFECGLSV